MTIQKLNVVVKTAKRGRYIDIYICYDEMDRFGKTKPIKKLFDTVLPYHLKRTLLQAENLIGG